MFKKMALAFSLACATLVAIPASAQDQLRFSAGPPGGNWFALGGALAETWSKEGIPTSSSTGGGVSNVVNTDRGKTDLGFSVTALVGAASKGAAPFKKPLDNVSVLANVYRQYTYFVMRKDYADENGIKSVADIVDKKLPIRLATLKPGTSSEFVIRSAFEKGLGVGWKDIQDWGGSVSFASYSDGSNQLADNHLDCFAFSVGRAASVVLKIESQLDVVILPVDKKILDAMTEALGTVSFKISPEIYKSVTDPVPTIGDYTSIIVRKDLDEDTVYKMTKALWENKDTLQKGVKAVAELNPEEAIPALAPAHPGAVKYWKSVQ
ncbi:TAXI family TRAP transporter solute-binding subunit [uncultured Cohaesibacter sp.]|uniref:TAXI family TRAP transporter solute-binding subunit n=1 Tax=uncultured Cohaesibacter sp. TaxID=1002546 RepID=UPI002A0A4FBD|nr:TAXI family TRAP transporter solute-binding subunit [uncultured Cohaesibacter sp.]